MSDLILWCLGKQPLFEGLAVDRLRQLAAAAACLEVQRNETIYAPGDVADTLYVIVGGRVRRYQAAAHAAITLGYHGARECFGEECVLSDMTRETFAEAVLPCKLLALPRAALAEFLITDARLRARLFDVIHARLRSAEARLVLRLRAPLVERTASALLELAVGHPRRRGRLQIAPALSVGELADYVGSSRIAMYGAIERLADAGVIVADGHAQIIDPDAAARFLHSEEDSHEIH